MCILCVCCVHSVRIRAIYCTVHITVQSVPTILYSKVQCNAYCILYCCTLYVHYEHNTHITCTLCALYCSCNAQYCTMQTMQTTVFVYITVLMHTAVCKISRLLYFANNVQCCTIQTVQPKLHKTCTIQ